MLKAMAVLRTLFLLFIVVFTVRATPMLVGLPSDISEPYLVCKESNDRFQRVIWLAVGWIAFETLVGWIMATRNGRKGRPGKLESDLPPPGAGAPPFASPR